MKIRPTSKGTRKELVQALRERQGTSTKSQKGRILDEFVGMTGLHRKHAVQLLGSPLNPPISRPHGRRRLYDDNGSEFMNGTLLDYCRDKGVEFTRGRPFHKNDQAWVEQKIGALVRRLLGYDRFEGMATAKVMGRLYTAFRLYINFFQPSFKLASKDRRGARETKHYHAPATPYERLLKWEGLSEHTKEDLRKRALELDLLRLLAAIRREQKQLGSRSSQPVDEGHPSEVPDLEAFLQGLTSL